MEQGKLTGTIKLFGCPAEEGGSGKVYMVREELFNDVDAVIHWHPASNNATAIGSSLADISVKFRFHINDASQESKLLIISEQFLGVLGVLGVKKTVENRMLIKIQNNFTPGRRERRGF